MAADLPSLDPLSPKDLYRAIREASAGAPVPIEVLSSPLQSMAMAPGEGTVLPRKELSPEEKKQLRKKNQEDLRRLNVAWLDQMVHSKAQLREKMALFWHGHFASRSFDLYFQQILLDKIRQHALGNFGELLHEVSKTAAMIHFLNNNQNRKDHPNENFAREVMELFTLGRGHYTEQDVKEAARCFTGWGANQQGEFVFRKFQHDSGEKTLLGKTGNFQGDDVLDILLAQKQTARFMANKIYRFLVNDRLDEGRAAWLGERFYQSRYDISQLLEDIFTSDWFYHPANIGARIKSPVELLAGLRRMLPMKIENEESQILVQRVLGQLLFFPPNVAGWPGGTSWIDSSSLMFRLRIPQILYHSDEIQLQAKTDDDQMMGIRDMPLERARVKGLGNMKKNAFIQVQINWEEFLASFARVPRESLTSALSGTLLQVPSEIRASTLEKYSDSGSRENFIKTTAIQIMSTPEYQLC